ncbi:hypothetical protein PtrSN001A_012079, partial [Pyrenophora tritici-repentis]
MVTDIYPAIRVEAITAGKLEIAIIEPSGKKSIDLAVFVPVFEGLYRGFAAEPVLADRYGFSVVDITTAAITVPSAGIDHGRRDGKDSK